MVLFCPDLLQVREVSHLALSENPRFAEELYRECLSSSETSKLVISFYVHVICVETCSICLQSSVLRDVTEWEP